MESHSPSSALVRKRQSSELALATPQLDRIKRPKIVLDEDEYTEGLSRVIARDFFPDLAAMRAQQEYLDALDSHNGAWISSADRQLREAMTQTPRRRRAPSPAASTAFSGRTPSVAPSYAAGVAQTPATVSSAFAMAKKPKIDTNMSLGKFQDKYTSEDNESVYKIMDRHNQKRADRNSWLWNGNKLPSKRMIKQKEVEDRRVLEGLPPVEDKNDDDDRPARPDSWDADPRNGLMFVPKGVDDTYENPSLKGASAKRLVYENTRMPQPIIPPRPPSPTLSAIRDAVHGRPRPQFSTESELAAGDETPRVNGYAYVDDESDGDDEEPSSLPPPIDLGPGDAKPNPFKIQDTRKREGLHHQLVARIAVSKREASGNASASATGSPNSQRTPAPRFISSPRVGSPLTPAAQRLLNNIGTPRRTGFEGSSATRTPGSRLRTMTKGG